MITILGGSGHAIADESDAICVGGPKDSWVTQAAIRERVTSILGSSDFILDFESNCYEAEFHLTEHAVIGVYLDPVTAEVIRIKGEEEDD